MRSEHGRTWQVKYAAQANNSVLLYLSFRHQPTTLSQEFNAPQCCGSYLFSVLKTVANDFRPDPANLVSSQKRRNLVRCFGSRLLNQEWSSCSKCRLQVPPVSEMKRKEISVKASVDKCQYNLIYKKGEGQNDTCQSISEARCFISSFFAAATLAASGSTWTPIHLNNRSENYVSACSTLLEMGNEFRWIVEEAVYTQCSAKYRVYLALAFSCHLAVQFSIVLVGDGCLERLHFWFYLHPNEYNKEEQWKS